jgi:glutamate racemase
MPDPLQFFGLNSFDDPLAERPIGIFDSGVGGLSVLRALRRDLPQEPVTFVADQAHVPYGSRPKNDVRAFSDGITRYLLGDAVGAKLIVVACNTASAAALTELRQTFPDTPFVGMEPAVKPAAETTRSGVVGVLATPATFHGALYASVVERFGNGIKIMQDTCDGLVQQIEAGALRGVETRTILKNALRPMLAAGIDTVVLGCTHYPFVIPLIEEIVGPKVRVIDPSPAVARQVRRLLDERGLRYPAALEQPVTSVQCCTTGDPAYLASRLPRLIGEVYPVCGLHWGPDGLG